ncbi:MAG TPA: hypothetical protein V6C85_21375 [Allocoleopsis sp.]
MVRAAKPSNTALRRNVLVHQIETGLHRRFGAALTNLTEDCTIMNCGSVQANQ